MWGKISLFVIFSLVALFLFSYIKRKLATYGRRFVRRSSIKALRRFRVRVERFKLTRKKYVIFQLLKERDIWEEMERYAKEHHISREQALDRVEKYIDEIVPFFNILSYYKFGYGIAHFLLNLVYNVVIDRENIKALSRVPKNSVVIYIMNHRSNADYILVAYMLAEHISLSYAVGEWARVWPLEYIFKSFGSYFIRRKFRDPLYHKVLEKYVQLISKNGITQGIFIEGGLSRDGKIRETKIGLLEYIILIKSDPDFTQDIVFIPTAINYDRVLEDMNLIREAHGAPPEKRGAKKLLSGLKIALNIPRVIVRNGFYYVFKGIRKYGYTSVAIGAPISLDLYLAGLKQDIFALPKEERRHELKKFANHVMRRVGDVIPITPVPFFSYAVLKDGRSRIPKTELVSQMRKIKKELVAKNARIVFGNEFLDLIEEKRKLAEVEEDRTMELVDFEYGIIETEEMGRIIGLALDVLSMRKIARAKRDTIIINPERTEILEYYKNSIVHFFE